MHKTLCETVLGHIDKIDNTGLTAFARGWCLHMSNVILPIRLVGENTEEYMPTIMSEERYDVTQFYNLTNDSLLCGWYIEVNSYNNYFLEMKILDKWCKIFNFKNIFIPTQIVTFHNKTPSYLVIDNFYSDPNVIRSYAINQVYESNTAHHKGKRSVNQLFRFNGLKERFEHILNHKIHNWNNYIVNGCFQYCIAEDKSVYHCDPQDYAGIIYLTPDAPVQTGTTFYRSKNTQKMKVKNDEYRIAFKNGHYDSTEFDVVDVVGNIYNRLVLFDAKIIHAAPYYFGTEIHNARLFQLFFFDLENSKN